MELKGNQFQLLIQALGDAFPDLSRLEMMVRLQLDKNINEISVQKALDLVLFDLIKIADSEGWLKDLIQKAHFSNPNNVLLKNYCNEYLYNYSLKENSPTPSIEKGNQCSSSTILGQEQAMVKKPHELLNPCNFDLSELIKQCLNILDEKQGIVGLAVSYDQDPFLKYFCERLKDRLGKSNISCKDALTLNYFTPVDQAVSIIKRYKSLLQTHEVICPIRVQVSDSTLSHEFWQKASAEFNNDFEYRLIIIMVGSESICFPKGVNQISSPTFTKADAHDWIVDVTKAMGWEDHVIDEWKSLMKSDCLQSDTNNGFLDVRLVYEHLVDTIDLLQKMPSADNFITTLKQRIQAYV
ncbi:hypothetical protein Cri9333_4757 (plasmid) [Crinalium epipsammum PCC 9333]|uniref:Effector-associated domain-containing protein n=1 Tax=Crinalium epipsammum PCC 9333 TaxID=1173022 RepID=K9W703_9CYAN|nr:effector-associated domain EAD1-containing protein [Crinalium epipsammum]AFZ15532.1 hypothetical protein Cri9333_4757 [Crinalium epipsammum PCC 9333]